MGSRTPLPNLETNAAKGLIPTTNPFGNGVVGGGNGSHDGDNANGFVGSALQAGLLPLSPQPSPLSVSREEGANGVLKTSPLLPPLLPMGNLPRFGRSSSGDHHEVHTRAVDSLQNAIAAIDLQQQRQKETEGRKGLNCGGGGGGGGGGDGDGSPLGSPVNTTTIVESPNASATALQPLPLSTQWQQPRRTTKNPFKKRITTCNS